MCGICGLYSQSTPGDKQQLVLQMNEQLRHRGPDGCGHFSDPCCSLAMRRLAIIDVAGGDQPIFSEDERFVIVFNGEIYNYQDLRRHLLSRGHHFRTNSDTEAILHLFEDQAEATPAHLKGMFAFCIYDRLEKTLFLARDRFGEKPLYYYYSPEHGFVFSSEIRSLLACPFIPRHLNHEALGYYLRAGLVPAPLTLFQDVYSLPPGHWLRLSDRQLTIRPYYTINFTVDKQLEREETAVEQVRDTLKQAVARQSVSEVPLGAFLSGGIDSSSVVAMLQMSQERPSKSLTVQFQATAYDESRMARQIATHLNTEHEEFVVPDMAFQSDDLWRIVEHVGMPFSDSSAIPTYFLCQQARQAVTVALSGDGGDELFAGYSYFRWGMALHQLQRVPHFIRRSAASLANRLAQGRQSTRLSALRPARRALHASLEPHPVLPVNLSAMFNTAEIGFLVADHPTRDVAASDLPLLTRLPAEAEQWSPLRRLMFYRLQHVLPARMLVKVDRMSMANSLEVRAPMLDVDLADLSMRLPDKHLVRNGTGKYILREAMRPHLPESVFHQPKSGFSIPLHRFQNQAYQALARELLLNGATIIQLFHRDAIRQIVEIGTVRQQDQADLSVYRASHQLWSLMQLSAWAQRFKVVI